jgi:hypothetical protein
MQSTPSEPAPYHSTIIRTGSDGRLRYSLAQRQELFFAGSGMSAMSFTRQQWRPIPDLQRTAAQAREQAAIPPTISGPAFAD